MYTLWSNYSNAEHQIKKTNINAFLACEKFDPSVSYHSNIACLDRKGHSYIACATTTALDCTCCSSVQMNPVMPQFFKNLVFVWPDLIESSHSIKWQSQLPYKFYSPKPFPAHLIDNYSLTFKEMSETVNGITVEG